DERIEGNLQVLEDNLRIYFDEGMWQATAMTECLATIKHIDQLKLDFARLFVGPYQLFAPPYGSVYLDGDWQVMGPSTLDVIERYRLGGLALSNDFHDAPDHIAVELEFLYFLTVKEVQATVENNQHAALAAQVMRNDFMHRHLGAWSAQFTKEVEENAETDFYRGVARCTRIFIESEMEQLEQVSTGP
ncbi:MAG: molecular chaperone TorD family protein, partial [Desulforhabdus sp.]|nr:molecular chaperone TorD family protein [Desulforhabdus sp.]